MGKAKWKAVYVRNCDVIRICKGGVQRIIYHLMYVMIPICVIYQFIGHLRALIFLADKLLPYSYYILAGLSYVGSTPECIIQNIRGIKSQIWPPKCRLLLWYCKASVFHGNFTVKGQQWKSRKLYPAKIPAIHYLPYLLFSSLDEYDGLFLCCMPRLLEYHQPVHCMMYI